MLLLLLGWFILAVVIANAARQRGRNGFGWFLISIFTTPLLAGVLLLIFPPLLGPIDNPAVDDRALRNAILTAELAANPPRGRRAPVIAAALCIGLLVAAFGVWSAINRPVNDAAASNTDDPIKPTQSSDGKRTDARLIAIEPATTAPRAAGARRTVLAETRVPEIKQGMPYREARSIILSAGWQPSFFKKSNLDEIQRVFQEWFTAAGFMEVESCAPTGDALCVAEFHDALGARKLYVFTTSGDHDEIKYLGHDPQIVSFCVNKNTVNCEEPLSARQLNSLMAGLNTCTKARAIEITRTPGSQVNDPCVVHWRSLEVQKHPERAMQLECAGFKAYEDPQPPGHPISLAECDRITRADQRRLGLPAQGLSQQQRDAYRATWGKQLSR